jgi:hypothetical protein
VPVIYFQLKDLLKMKKLTNDAIDTEKLNEIAATLNKSFGYFARQVGKTFAAMNYESMVAALVKLQEQERDRIWRDDPLQLKAKYLDPGTRHFKDSVGWIAAKVETMAVKVKQWAKA